MQTETGLTALSLGPATLLAGPAGLAQVPGGDGFSLLLDKEPARPGTLPEDVVTGAPVAAGGFWPSAFMPVLPEPGLDKGPIRDAPAEGLVQAAAPAPEDGLPSETPRPVVGVGLETPPRLFKDPKAQSAFVAIRTAEAEAESRPIAVPAAMAAGVDFGKPQVQEAPPSQIVAGRKTQAASPPNVTLPDLSTLPSVTAPGAGSAKADVTAESPGLRPDTEPPSGQTGPAVQGKGQTLHQNPVANFLPGAQIADPSGNPTSQGRGKHVTSQAVTGGTSNEGQLQENRSQRSDPQAPAIHLAPDSRLQTTDRGPATGPEDRPAAVGSTPEQPDATGVAQSLPARATGAEGYWLGRMFLLAGTLDGTAHATGEMPPGGPVTGAVAQPSAQGQGLLDAPATGASVVPPETGGHAILASAQVEEALPFPGHLHLGAEGQPGAPQVFPAGPGPANGPVPQLALQIAATLKQQPEGGIEVALSPEELGHVTLKLQADSQNPDRMVVQLAFDRPETMELFRRHADQLTEAIRAAGYAEARLDFGQSGNGAGNTAGNRPAGHSGQGPDQSDTPTDAPMAGTSRPDQRTPLRLSGLAGMDLRL